MRNAILLLTLFTCINYSNELIAQPTITSFSPASGSVGTLVTIYGSNLISPTAFTIGSVPAIVISNTGTTLVGMVMPGAVSNIISISTSGGSVSSTINFTIKSTLYPYSQQGNKLVGTGAAVAARQGVSVCVSADGNTAIVGGNQDGSFGGPANGAVWIYTRSGSVWSQQGIKLVGTGATGAASQGYSVSISADGNTAIVGGYNDNTGTGAVWIFSRSGYTWTQQGNKLVGTGAIGAALQGCSVSISADGNTAIVGGRNDSLNKGSAWIYTRSGSVWSQQGVKLKGSGSIGESFQGTSVSISSDGNTAIVGGNSDNSGTGAVWIYTRSGSVWSQQGNKLVGTGGGSAPYQGQSVSISSDGNTAIVGGQNDSSSRGAVWIYTRSGSVWSQQGNKLVGTGATGAAQQGCSVSISADGNTAIVGGYYDNSQVGAAWIYISYISNIITYSRSICYGTPNISLSGNTPIGLIAPVKYKWLASSVGALTGFGIAGGNDSSQSYSTNGPTQTTWYRRIVSSGNNVDTSVSITITVNPKPNVGFTQNNIAQCLSGNSFVLNDTSVISSGTLTRLWNFGDATNASNLNPNKNYLTAGTYQIKLIVTSNNNCKDSLVKNVIVFPQPKSGFTINNTSQCLSGNSFVLNDTSVISSGTLTRLWNFGDATTLSIASTNKNYSSYGTYQIKLVVTSNNICKDSLVKNVIVFPQPKSGFTINKLSQCLIGNYFSFDDTTNTTSIRLWSLGDLTTNVSDTFSKTYSNAGTYSVKLKVTDAHSCKDSSIKVVTVNANPAKPTVAATTKSLLQSSLANSYQWYQNGNALSGETNQTLPITTNGSYVVSIDSLNGCSNLSNPFNATSVGLNTLNVIDEINIYPNPTNNILNITFPLQSSPVNINLVDVTGRNIKSILSSKSNYQIDVSDLNIGIYFISISGKEINVMKKIIINKL